MDNNFILSDRLDKIRQIITQYGEDNFYLSFSGGKDSTVLSALLDMAIPDNMIPRVYANTGIEYQLILEFVEREREREHPWELIIIKPSVPIKPMLEKEGYPFKSKRHAEAVCAFWHSRPEWTIKYYNGKYKYTSERCPKKLKYQFEQGLPFKVSARCCDRLKKEPLHKWQDENGKPYAIIGLMREEGGRRENAKCLAFKGKKMNFQPLVVVTKEWEDWFIDKYDVDISDIYKPPYSFERTGCKACPFGIGLQQELDILQQYFPNERKQCEAIWKPVYDEYRRIGYRLRKPDGQMTLDDYLEKEGKQ